MKECPRCGGHAEDNSETCPYCSRDLSGLRPSQTPEEERANEQRLHAHRQRLRLLLPNIPIVTVEQPKGWDCRPLTIVTAQTVIGTGLVAEVVSEVTDLLGLRSQTYIKKLRAGEETCLDALRFEAARLGADAVIGVRVRHASLGGVKGMLMVCMTGTAAKVDNMSSWANSPAKNIAELHQLATELSKE